ncbi:hypothetical protein P618_200992 [Holospora obtusa F1]|uniref:Core-binding (CB) domain-containing protein n=1 Tax=Holospora obtusa F1 TaxID=1399147 RepID=W6TDL4_HOLOB|nr:hypothetical protein P618_200992 [Holospora obtusa F1]
MAAGHLNRLKDFSHWLESFVEMLTVEKGLSKNTCRSCL